jgi:hypothetical protein
VTVPALLPVLVKVWAMLLPDPLEAPVTPDCVAVHENVVPGVVLDKVSPVVWPEQIEVEVRLAVAVGVVTLLTLNVWLTGPHPATASLTDTV